MPSAVWEIYRLLFSVVVFHPADEEGPESDDEEEEDDNDVSLPLNPQINVLCHHILSHLPLMWHSYENI